MDAPAPTAAVPRVNHFLPYAAVFQADLKQTLRCWIYRLWAFLSVSATAGYLVYRYGAIHEAGLIQRVPHLLNDLATWIVWGSVTLIIVLTAGAICGERGTLADSVLSRGISRFQYFLGKWHARLLVVLGTFFVLASVTLVASLMLLDSSTLSLPGCGVAFAVVASLLVMIVTCGVTVSALANTTVVAITVVWMSLYGVGFLLSLLPANYPAPDRALRTLPDVLQGIYDLHVISRLIAGSLSLSLMMAVVGMIGFSRKDV